VVDALAKGGTVVTVFPLDGQRVAGPEVRRVVDEAGREGIEIVVGDCDAGRTLVDLPRLDHELSAHRVGSIGRNLTTCTHGSTPRTCPKARAHQGRPSGLSKGQ